jgi:hypothetical protein
MNKKLVNLAEIIILVVDDDEAVGHGMESRRFRGQVQIGTSAEPIPVSSNFLR